MEVVTRGTYNAQMMMHHHHHTPARRRVAPDKTSPATTPVTSHSNGHGNGSTIGRSRSASPVGVKRRSPSPSDTPPAKRGRISAPTSPVSLSAPSRTLSQSSPISLSGTRGIAPFVLQTREMSDEADSKPHINRSVSNPVLSMCNHREHATPPNRLPVLYNIWDTENQLISTNRPAAAAYAPDATAAIAEAPDAAAAVAALDGAVERDRRYPRDEESHRVSLRGIEKRVTRSHVVRKLFKGDESDSAAIFAYVPSTIQNNAAPTLSRSSPSKSRRSPPSHQSLRPSRDSQRRPFDTHPTLGNSPTRTSSRSKTSSDTPSLDTPESSPSRKDPYQAQLLSPMQGSSLRQVEMQPADEAQQSSFWPQRMNHQSNLSQLPPITETAPASLVPEAPQNLVHITDVPEFVPTESTTFEQPPVAKFVPQYTVQPSAFYYDGQDPHRMNGLRAHELKNEEQEIAMHPVKVNGSQISNITAAGTMQFQSLSSRIAQQSQEIHSSFHPQSQLNFSFPANQHVDHGQHFEFNQQAHDGLQTQPNTLQAPHQSHIQFRHPQQATRPEMPTDRPSAPCEGASRAKVPLKMLTVGLLDTYRNLTQTFNKMLEEETKERKQTKQNFYQVQKGETLGNKYKVLDIIGKGSFGQVVKAQPIPDPLTGDVDPDVPQEVAIKIIRKSAPFLAQGRREVDILSTIKDNFDKGTNFIVQFVEDFMHAGHLCIVFELLSHSLLDLVNLTLQGDPAKPGLSLRMVHKLTHQLVCVLVTLADMEIIHCDLKPENVALASPNKAHIKVLDFGSSCHSFEKVCNLYPYIQSRFYRAPEILLGCRYGFPIDMWSLGCLIVELYTAKPLFSGRDSVEQLYCIMDVLGPPPHSMLHQAVYLKKYFKHTDGKLFPRRKFKWRDRKLREIIAVKPENSEHFEAFFDLVSQMLTYDPAKRITPCEALNHPFIQYGPASRLTRPPTKFQNPFSRPMDGAGLQRPFPQQPPPVYQDQGQQQHQFYSRNSQSNWAQPVNNTANNSSTSVPNQSQTHLSQPPGYGPPPPVQAPTLAQVGAEPIHHMVNSNRPISSNYFPQPPPTTPPRLSVANSQNRPAHPHGGAVMSHQSAPLSAPPPTQPCAPFQQIQNQHNFNYNLNANNSHQVRSCDPMPAQPLHQQQLFSHRYSLVQAPVWVQQKSSS